MTWQQINLIGDTNTLFTVHEWEYGDRISRLLVCRSYWTPPKTSDEALELSIAKWEHIIRLLQSGTVLDREGGHSTCGLCHMYYDECDDEESEDGTSGCCGDCPIARHTGFDRCENTPYEAFVRLSGVPTADPGDLIATAQAELDLLVSLRKKTA